MLQCQNITVQIASERQQIILVISMKSQLLPQNSPYYCPLIPIITNYQPAKTYNLFSIYLHSYSFKLFILSDSLIFGHSTIFIIIMRIYLCLLLFLSFAFSQTPSQCQDIIDTWQKNITNIPAVTAADSGKFFNDLGDYNNCLFHDDQFTYLTISLLNMLTKGYQYVGLCVPNICVEYMESSQFSSTLQAKLNEMYNSATNTSGIIFAKMRVYSPVETNQKMGAGSYITIAFILSLLIFQITSSIILGIKQSNGQATNTKAMKILKSFSIYDNFKKIIQIRPSENQNLLFLNGLRVLSICWIIFGHDQWFRFMNLKNWIDSLEILTTPGLATLVPAAYFAVDVFFWIGGFLITIGLVSKMKKSKANPVIFYLVAVFHRFVRVWPTYMVAILIYWKVAPYLLSGPIWSSFYSLSSSCDNGGIVWNMFFIDNFGDHGPAGMDYCFGWGWYLAVDFQFFLITPLIFFLYNKNKVFGFGLTFLIWLGSIITAFVMIMVNDWRYPIPNPKFPPQPEFMDKFYYKPYIRVSAYMMGIWVGMFYLEWKAGAQRVVSFVNKVKNSVLLRTLFYIVGMGLINLTIWVIIPFQKYGNWTTTGQAFYNSLNRVAFLAGLTLVTFPAMFGCKNDPVHIILGHKIFSPGAKISFCMYLTHFIVIMMGVFSNRMDLYWQPISSVYLIISDIFWAMVTATFLSLLIESPTLGIQKVLTSGDSKSQEKPLKEEPKRIQFEEDKQFSAEIKKPLITSSSMEVVNDIQL